MYDCAAVIEYFSVIKRACVNGAESVATLPDVYPIISRVSTFPPVALVTVIVAPTYAPAVVDADAPSVILFAATVFADAVPVPPPVSPVS